MSWCWFWLCHSCPVTRWHLEFLQNRVGISRFWRWMSERSDWFRENLPCCSRLEKQKIQPVVSNLRESLETVSTHESWLYWRKHLIWKFLLVSDRGLRRRQKVMGRTRHFPSDTDWRWSNVIWNDMISSSEVGPPKQKNRLHVLPYSLNSGIMTLPCSLVSTRSIRNTSEMSLAFRRRTIDLVCALPHQLAVTRLHPNWGN